LSLIYNEVVNEYKSSYRSPSIVFISIVPSLVVVFGILIKMYVDHLLSFVFFYFHVVPWGECVYVYNISMSEDFVINQRWKFLQGFIFKN
jgi:hypothetical protein